jgi:hypothetical protein
MVDQMLQLGVSKPESIVLLAKKDGFTHWLLCGLLEVKVQSPRKMYTCKLMSYMHAGHAG